VEEGKRRLSDWIELAFLVYLLNIFTYYEQKDDMSKAHHPIQSIKQSENIYLRLLSVERRRARWSKLSSLEIILLCPNFKNDGFNIKLTVTLTICFRYKTAMKAHCTIC